MMEIVVSPTATALVALMRLKGVGRQKALGIVDGPDRGVDRASFRETVLSKASRAGLPQKELVDAWQRSEEQLQQSREAGIRAFSWYDDGYPWRLRGIPDPPAVLFVRGDVSGLRAPKSVAVVGT